MTVVRRGFRAKDVGKRKCRNAKVKTPDTIQRTTDRGQRTCKAEGRSSFQCSVLSFQNLLNTEH